MANRIFEISSFRIFDISTYCLVGSLTCRLVDLYTR